MKTREDVKIGVIYEVNPEVKAQISPTPSVGVFVLGEVALTINKPASFLLD